MVIEIPNYISSTYKMKKQNTVKKQRMPVLPSSKNISTSQTVHDVSPQFFFFGGGGQLPLSPSPSFTSLNVTLLQLTSYHVNWVAVSEPWSHPVNRGCEQSKKTPRLTSFWLVAAVSKHVSGLFTFIADRRTLATNHVQHYHSTSPFKTWLATQP